MAYAHRIVSDRKIMLGKPIIKGTRITVMLILKKLSEGTSMNDLIQSYPHLTKEDILAVLSYSADVISRKEIIAV